MIKENRIHKIVKKCWYISGIILLILINTVGKNNVSYQPIISKMVIVFIFIEPIIRMITNIFRKINCHHHKEK